jgi:hypothetical protein
MGLGFEIEPDITNQLGVHFGACHFLRVKNSAEYDGSPRPPFVFVIPRGETALDIILGDELRYDTDDLMWRPLLL